MRKLEQSELEILNKMTEQHKAKYRNRKTPSIYIRQKKRARRTRHLA